MPRPKKSKAEELARIRNNQRKCRERRQNYLAELEQKLTSYENEKVEWIADSAKLQARTRKLRQENETLKKLLGLSCLGEDSQYQSPIIEVDHLRTDWDNSSTQMQSLLDINIEPGILPVDVCEDETSIELPSVDGNTQLLNSNGSELDKSIARSQVLSGSIKSKHDSKSSTPTPSFSIIPPLWSPFYTTELEIPTSSSLQSTAPQTLWPMLNEEMAREDKTLVCSIAYRLILQFNKRQYSDSEIDSKICHGFRQGRTQSETCRVDNEVLFAVLSEISS